MTSLLRERLNGARSLVEEIRVSLTYSPSPLAVLSPFRGGSEVPQEWTTEMSIYLLQHGRQQFVSAAIELLETDAKVALLTHLSCVPPIDDFYPRSGRDGQKSLAQEIIEGSQDREALLSALATKKRT